MKKWLLVGAVFLVGALSVNVQSKSAIYLDGPEPRISPKVAIYLDGPDPRSSKEYAIYLDGPGPKSAPQNTLEA